MNAPGIVSAIITAALVVALPSASFAAEPKSEKEQVQADLKRFDQLDFDAYSRRKDMKLFRELHCPDVKVVFPDGRTTLGIDQHGQDAHGYMEIGRASCRERV